MPDEWRLLALGVSHALGPDDERRQGPLIVLSLLVVLFVVVQVGRPGHGFGLAGGAVAAQSLRTNDEIVLGRLAC